MRWVARLAAMLVLALAIPASAQAPLRLALVIGNAAYPGGTVPALVRPREDAGRIAHTLDGLGFAVTPLYDQDRGQIMRAVQAFAARLEANPGAVGFFYYAGHGASAPVDAISGVGRENYIIPVREAISSGGDLAVGAVPLGFVTRALSRAQAKAVFVVVDACRNDLPWTRAGGAIDPDRGFAVIGNAPPGLLIAFATPDGATTPDDGAYARLLSDELKKPQDHVDAFRNTNIAVTREAGRAGRPPVLIDQIPEKICFGSCTGVTERVVADPLMQRRAEDAERRAAALEEQLRRAQQPPPGAPAPTAVNAIRPQTQSAPSAGQVTAGQTFRDCGECPELVVIRAGSFIMGSPAGEAGRQSSEGPQRTVTVRSFAAGKFEVTFQQWTACASAGGCGGWAANADERTANRPVISVSWTNAQDYVRWLSARTNKRYRLLTEAEWEYAARAGTSVAYSTGATITQQQAQFSTGSRTAAVGSFPANPWGLHDMHGNVMEWVEDCYSDSYAGAPTDGSAVVSGGCPYRVLRGGSWLNPSHRIRSAARSMAEPGLRQGEIGFRVARAL